MPFSQRFRNPFKVVLMLAFFAALVWAAYLGSNPAKDTLWNYGYNIMNALVYLIGGAAGIYYAISPRMPQNLRKALLNYGIGMICWSIAGLLWSYFNIFLKVEVPYPSVNDFFFIIFMLFVSVGSIYLMKHFDIRITRRNALESTLIIMGTYIAVFFVVSPPDLSSSLPLPTMMFNFIYPVSDAFMFALALVIFRASEENLAPSVRYLMIGLLLQAVGDFVFGYLTTAGTYWNGDVSDVMYTLSGFMLSAGVISLASRSRNALKGTK